MTLVSVVVATYRREGDLGRALESLAAQTYPSVEIVLVDDNSDPEWNGKVSRIVNAFRAGHPAMSLTYIANSENQGSAEVRNTGITVAKGAYITFLDDDDIYLPEKIEKQVGFMESGGYDYSITDLILYSENGKEIDRRIRTYISDTSVSALRRAHLKHHMTGTDTMMFRAEYLKEIGGFAPIDVGDEFYLMQRAIEGGGKFGYLPGCDIKAYVHTGEGGLSSGDRKIAGENALFAYKKTFFPKLTKKDIRYIKMRHYAVIAYAELRRKAFSRFVSNAMRAFLVSPLQFIMMIMDR